MRAWLQYLPRGLRERLIRSQLKIEDTELQGLVVKVATTVDEHEQAARLVHDAYLRRGIIPEQRSGVWVTAHGLLPWTVVFVAKRGERVIGTISLVLDSKVGLPMDKIFIDEISSLRAMGRKLAEVGALSVESGLRGRGVAFLLNKIMYRCAAELLGVDDLVIAVHPHAACLYEATLRFVALGKVRSYPGMNASALAIPLRLDLHTVEQNLARDFSMLGDSTRSPHHLYFVRPDPQIQLPDAAALQLNQRVVRKLAAEQLGELRKEAFAEPSPPRRRLLRPIFPKFSDALRSVMGLDSFE